MKNMIKTLMVRTMINAVPLALFGTFLIPTPTPLMDQIAASKTIYTNNSISYPISKAYVNGNMAYFIATDASDNQTAASIAENLGYEVNYAPTLTLVSSSAQQQGYEFVDGVKGVGVWFPNSDCNCIARR
jgi:hypothetical protein